MMDVHRLFALLSLHAVLVLFFNAHSSQGFLWWGTNEKKVDGKWSAWSSYSSCQIPLTKNSYPYRFKQRSCTNPAPKNGGKSCIGQSRRNSPCSDCDTPLGMEDNRISDSQLTSSSFHEEFPPNKARLNGPSAWCAGDLSGEVYLQVDLKRLTLLTAVATQGFFPDPKKLSLRLGSVSKYRITFSDDGTNWDVHQNRYTNHSIFNGNKRDAKTVLNILEPNIAARYVRILPTARIHFACMKLELYGCQFKFGGYLPQVPGDLLAASSETEDLDCFWHIHLPKSKKINFDFINFDLPCSVGHVEIRGSGPSYGRSQLLGHLCGYISAPPPVVSNGNKMWIRFQSNSSDPMIGLYGTYFPNCDHEYNSSEGVLTTPNFPKNYNHNSLCKWLISVPQGKAVKLTFIDFEVEGDPDNGPKCLNDHVIITEGNASSKMEMGRYCNTNKPPRYLCSHGNRIEIQFKSDDILSFKGFNALFKAKEPNAPCVEPSSTIITPSPTISMFSSTIAPLNYSSSAILRIVPTATVAMSSSVISNSSIGIPGARPGLNNVMGQKNDDDDDDRESGLTTIIIISVFSFIVLIMIIASVVPSVIRGYEKRRREREWIAAADLAVKKNGVGNGYEMQPIKPSVIVDDEKPEPNEATAFLDPEQGLSDEHITYNPAPYPSVGLKDEEEEMDGSVAEDLGCDLEYDPTDLNLGISYEDLGTSFATEMAIMMNHISPGKAKSDPSELSKYEDDDNSTKMKNKTTKNNNDHDNDNGHPQEKDSQDTLEDGRSEDSKELSESRSVSPEELNPTPDNTDSAEVVASIEEKNDKLQKALNDLKATLTQVNSDSGSIPEIQNPDTNSTVSMRGSQEIDNMPPVDIINPIWERNATGNPSSYRKRSQEECNEEKHGPDGNSPSVPGNDKDSGHYSSNSADQSTVGNETCV